MLHRDMKPANILALALLVACGGREPPDAFPPPAPPQLESSAGELRAGFHDNAGGLSGVVALVHAPTGAPAFSSVGLNYEHAIGSLASPRGALEDWNRLAPRRGPMALLALPDGAALVRRAADDERAVGARIEYRLVPPHYLDFSFDATIERAAPFGSFAQFFFASYMAPTADGEITFRGVAAPGAGETWVRSTPGVPGDHYGPLGAAPLAADYADPAIALNVGMSEWPRLTRPFYFGRVGGMVYAVLLETADEVRFTVMRWHRLTPAWDFSVVARDPRDGRRVVLRGRVVWKPFVSADDVAAEYDRWKAGP